MTYIVSSGTLNPTILYYTTTTILYYRLTTLIFGNISIASVEECLIAAM